MIFGGAESYLGPPYKFWGGAAAPPAPPLPTPLAEVTASRGGPMASSAMHFHRARWENKIVSIFLHFIQRQMKKLCFFIG